MPGLAHLYIGEEAVAVGVCEALRSDDYITSTHRGHGHCLAKGATPDLHVLPSCSARKPATARARAARCTSPTRDTGNLGANAIVGGSAGIATGAGFAAKYSGTGQVAVCFFGEGALGQGLLYEEMNLAPLWKLPVIFVCENNGYNEYTHFSESTAGDDVGARRGVRHRRRDVDGQDVRAVYDGGADARSSGRAAARARRSSSATTYRYHGHHVGDIARAYYRPKAEEEEWVTSATRRAARRVADGQRRRRSRRARRDPGRAVDEMDAAVEFARRRALSRTRAR